jgi:hypothetical protein
VFEPGWNSLNVKSALSHDTVAAPVCACAAAGTSSTSAATAIAALTADLSPLRPVAFP